MQIDKFGIVYFTENDVCNMLYTNHDIDLSKIILDNPLLFNTSAKKLHTGLKKISAYSTVNITVEEFDHQRQATWKMPKQYQEFDIENWLIGQCQNTEQIDRVRLELDLFTKTNLIMLLRYIKYLVDTMIKENIVWGVGRGSSTASYVLYLIGLHMIDSIKYNISIDEFFKKGSNHG